MMIFLILILLNLHWVYSGGDSGELLHLLRTQEELVIPHVQLFKFAAIGDFGGKPTPPYRTSVQDEVAHSLAKLVRRQRALFVVGLGDNFYDAGILSANQSDGTSDRFRSTFEMAYTEPYKSLRVPWLMVAGNHDHLGSVDQQLNYARAGARSWWVFPARFWHRRLIFPSDEATHRQRISVDFLFLDGTLFNAQSLKRPFAQVEDTAAHRRLLASDGQRHWALRHINESRADVLVVVCHQPLMSVAEYGGYRSLISALQRPLEMAAPKVLVLSGHSHTLQHFVHNGVSYVVSGSGSRVNRYRFNWFNVPPGSLQFYAPTAGVSLVSVNRTAVELSLIRASDEKVIHSFNF